MRKFGFCLFLALVLVQMAVSQKENQNIHGRDDIFKAIGADSRDEVLELSKNKEKLNAKGPGGQTPLMFSILRGKAWAVDLLLKAGADVTIGEKDGYSPMHGAGFQGRADIAKVLLDHGLSPNEKHQDGFFPLHRACWGSERRHTDTVRVFLEAGVDPLSTSKDGKTCLDMTNNEATKSLIRTWKSDNAEL